MATDHEVWSKEGDGRAPVLVVEDEADLRDLYCEYLRLNGHQAVGASHGAEAMSLLAHTRPCAIVLDLMMPVMDGWQTLRALRADQRFASIPVVLATAFPAAAQSAGPRVAAVLQKPFALDALVDVLEKVAPGREGP